MKHSEQTLTLDRCEGELAVFETTDKEFISLSKTLLPADAEEGDVYIYRNGMLQLDLERTQSRRKVINDKLQKVFRRTN